jgi:uncharacterized protein YxjI
MRYVIREKFFHLGEDSVITDDAGTPRFQVDGKLFSLHDRLLMRDMAGNEVAEIHRKLLALTPTYEIERKGVEVEMRKQLFSPFIDRYTIDVPGPDDLAVEGNLFEHEYTFRRGGQVVATVSKQWISLTATYGVEVASGEDDVLILACVLALDLAEDREH